LLSFLWLFSLHWTIHFILKPFFNNGMMCINMCSYKCYSIYLEYEIYLFFCLCSWIWCVDWTIITQDTMHNLCMFNITSWLSFTFFKKNNCNKNLLWSFQNFLWTCNLFTFVFMIFSSFFQFAFSLVCKLGLFLDISFVIMSFMKFSHFSLPLILFWNLDDSSRKWKMKNIFLPMILHY